MLAVRLPTEIETRLDALARTTQRPKSFYVREALELYLKGEEWQVQEIVAAVEAADRPGAKFADHEKVSAWLKTWGTDHETEPPICG